MSDLRKLTLTVEKDVSLRAKSKVALEDTSLSVVVERLLLAWLAGNVEVETARRPKNQVDKPQVLGV